MDKKGDKNYKTKKLSHRSGLGVDQKRIERCAQACGLQRATRTRFQEAISEPDTYDINANINTNITINSITNIYTNSNII